MKSIGHRDITIRIEFQGRHFGIYEVSSVNAQRISKVMSKRFQKPAEKRDWQRLAESIREIGDAWIHYVHLSYNRSEWDLPRSRRVVDTSATKLPVGARTPWGCREDHRLVAALEVGIKPSRQAVYLGQLMSAVTGTKPDSQHVARCSTLLYAHWDIGWHWASPSTSSLLDA